MATWQLRSLLAVQSRRNRSGWRRFLNSPECGDGITCSKLNSFSVSTVALPAEVAHGPKPQSHRSPGDGNDLLYPSSRRIHIAAKRAEEKAFWDELGFQPFFHLLWLGKWVPFASLPRHTLQQLQHVRSSDSTVVRCSLPWPQESFHGVGSLGIEAIDFWRWTFWMLH